MSEWVDVYVWMWKCVNTYVKEKGDVDISPPLYAYKRERESKRTSNLNALSKLSMETSKTKS